MTRVVLVTGGTSGIGLALAEAFIAQGAHVIVCGRSAAGLERFSHMHPSASAVRADVTVLEDRMALLEEITDRFGRVDILVNNAGTFVERDFTTGIGALRDLEQEVAVNLTAPIELTAEVLSRWPSPEAIVFVTSGFALISPTRAPTYGALKAGLHAFAEALRRQLAASGTHVLELLPPMTDTPMNAAASGKKMSSTEVAAVALDALARRRQLALPGPTKLLPFMLRVAPMITRRVVGST